MAPSVRKRTSVPGGTRAGSWNQPHPQSLVRRGSAAHQNPPQPPTSTPHSGGSVTPRGERGWGGGQPGPSMAQTRRVGSRATAKLEKRVWEQRGSPPGSGPQNSCPLQRARRGLLGEERRQKKEQFVAKSNQLTLDLVGEGLGAPTLSANIFLPAPAPRAGRLRTSAPPVSLPSVNKPPKP